MMEIPKPYVQTGAHLEQNINYASVKRQIAFSNLIVFNFLLQIWRDGSMIRNCRKRNYFEKSAKSFDQFKVSDLVRIQPVFCCKNAACRKIFSFHTKIKIFLAKKYCSTDIFECQQDYNTAYTCTS